MTTPLARVLEAARENARDYSPSKWAENFIQDVVSRAIPNLEESRNLHRLSGEDALTAHLLASLRASYPNVSTQTNSNGSADIYLGHYLMTSAVLKGEAKLLTSWNASTYFDAMQAGVNWYTTTSDAVALLVFYWRAPHLIGGA